MAINFDNKIPEWKNEGVEPSEDLKESGFKGGYKPPASVFNWFWCLVQKCVTELQSVVKSHVDNTNNPHEVTKTQIGLGNVDNTADLDKPISAAMSLAMEDYVSRSKDSTVAKNVKINFASTAQSISGDTDNLYLNASEYIVANNTLKLEYSGIISEDVDYAVSGKAVYNYIHSLLTPTEITTENLNDLSEGIYWGDYNNNAVNKPKNAKNFYLRVINIDRNGNTENLIENGDCVPVKTQVMLVGSNIYQRSYMLEYEGVKTYYWTDWRTI